MKLPALGIAMTFAFGIACGLSPAVTYRGNSRGFVAFLLCSAATSLLIGVVFAWRSQVCCRGCGVAVVLGAARRSGGLHRGTTERADHILRLADAGKINLKSP
jgi:hypothetical protein